MEVGDLVIEVHESSEEEKKWASQMLRKAGFPFDERIIEVSLLFLHTCVMPTLFLSLKLFPCMTLSVIDRLCGCPVQFKMECLFLSRLGSALLKEGRERMREDEAQRGAWFKIFEAKILVFEAKVQVQVQRVR